MQSEAERSSYITQDTVRNTHAKILTTRYDKDDSNHLGIYEPTTSSEHLMPSPVSVDIVVKDVSLQPLLANVGVSILYYCKKCAFSSSVFLQVTDHMRSCVQCNKDDCVNKNVPYFVRSDQDESDQDDVYEETISALSHHQDVAASVDSKIIVKRKCGRPSKFPPHNVVMKLETVNDGAALAEEDNGLAAIFCERCPSLALQSEMELSHHVKCHSKDGKLRCHICADDIPRLWTSLKQHLNAVHAVHFELHCLKCDVLFASHAEFRSHVNAQHSFPCPHCKYVSLNSAHAQTHLRCHDPDDVTRFRCYVCDTTISTWFSLHCHLVANHPGEIAALYSCTKCGRGFQYTHVLRKHTLTCGKSKLPCLVCAILVHPKGMAAHMRTHDQTRMSNGGTTEAVRCHFCYKKFADDARLQLHIQFVHAPERMLPVLCEQCGKSFMNGIRLRNHVREVHECVRRKKRLPRPKITHVCEICGYVTPDRERLRNHQLSAHAGIQPYTCDKCDYCTNEKSNARKHRLKHLGVKKFACDICEYRTNARWLLVKHCQRKHSITMPPWQPKKPVVLPIPSSGTELDEASVQTASADADICVENATYCEIENAQILEFVNNVATLKTENDAP